MFPQIFSILFFYFAMYVYMYRFGSELKWQHKQMNKNAMNIVKIWSKSQCFQYVEGGGGMTLLDPPPRTPA